MTYKKDEAGNLLPMIVTPGVTVNVLPNVQHEYLMTTKEVACGYGVSEYAIRVNKLRHTDELIEGKHYVIAVTICNSDLPSALKTAHNAVLWTKSGIIRLGFFIKSERARLFRDWAENLILSAGSQKQLPARKTKANRLTNERIIDIMADVCKIDDKELRLSITNKLLHHGNI